MIQRNKLINAASSRFLSGLKSALLFLLAALLAIGNFSASAGETAAKCFATLTTADLSRGPADPTPQQLEAAETAKESRPAADDQEGHWGEAVEGFQLSVRFEKEIFRAGEPVMATVLIRNVTDKKVFYRDFVGVKGDSPVCQFDVLDEQQKPVARLDVRAPEDIADGPHIPRGLKPGTQCRYDVKLEGKFNLSQPGKYTIRARRWIHKLQGDGYAPLKSGEAAITILEKPILNGAADETWKKT